MTSMSTRRELLKQLGYAGLALSTMGIARSEDLDYSRRPGPARAGVMPDPADSLLMFFNDEPLFARSKVTRRLGRPVRRTHYHETLGNCAWGYPTVFRCDDGKWRMIYQAGINKPRWGGGICLLAESSDGLNWTPRSTEAVTQIPNRSAPHQIIPDFEEVLLSGCFEDHRAPAAERYKLLTVQADKRTMLWVSGDLIRWEKAEHQNWEDEAPDPPSCPYWNPIKKRYQIMTRPAFMDRRITVVETADWKNFSPRKLVMEADSDDPPLAQVYGFYVVPYESYFVGLPWLFYAGDASSNQPATPHRYLGGRQETYLAYSINGDHWQRCLHQPLFKNGQAGEPDSGCLQVSSVVKLDDGGLRCYASCSRGEHGYCPSDDGYIVTYDLRKDGFVCLEAGDEPGLVGTRALYWVEREMMLNIDASGGTARVRIVYPHGEEISGFGFDDNIALSEDATRWIPQWKSGRKISELAGSIFRVEIELRHARLYSLRGRFVRCWNPDLWRHTKSGLAPVLQPGF